MPAAKPRIPPDPRLVTVEFVRASGPGGQNVNKVATAVELRFDAAAAGFSADMLARLGVLAGRRMTQDGVIVIEAQRFRSQDRNREDALVRLTELLEQAAQRPRRRIGTKPTRASRERRLGAKLVRSRIKQGRATTGDGSH